MTSFFDRQVNCQCEPERGLTLAFLLISLDPLTPGMPKAGYELQWLTAGGVGSPRELAYRAAFALQDVYIEPFDFVISLEGAWFAEWAASIADGESDPSASCVSNSF